MDNHIAELIVELLGTLSIAIIVAISIVSICFVVLYIVAAIKLFEKCGKEAWKAIIPFYSNYVLYVEICGLHWGWFAGWLAVTLVSMSNSVVTILKLFVNAMAFYNLATKCEKDPIPSMIFGGIFPHIVLMIYGFSKINYKPEIEVKDSGMF